MYMMQYVRSMVPPGESVGAVGAQSLCNQRVFIHQPANLHVAFILYYYSPTAWVQYYSYCFYCFIHLHKPILYKYTNANMSIHTVYTTFYTYTAFILVYMCKPVSIKVHTYLYTYTLSTLYTHTISYLIHHILYIIYTTPYILPFIHS